jgi:hypothetical protein
MKDVLFSVMYLGCTIFLPSRILIVLIMGKLKNRDHKILHMNPSALSFSIFTRDEIKKLSQVKITTPLSFNALGHPLKGGLYDPALGKYISKNGDKEVLCNMGPIDT